jgi:hypothetical protein
MLSGLADFLFCLPFMIQIEEQEYLKSFKSGFLGPLGSAFAH